MTDHMLHNLTDLDQGKAWHQQTKRLIHMTDKLNTKINQIDGFLERLHIFEGNLKFSYNETKEKVTSQVLSNIKLQLIGEFLLFSEMCPKDLYWFG